MCLCLIHTYCINFTLSRYQYAITPRHIDKQGVHTALHLVSIRSVLYRFHFTTDLSERSFDSLLGTFIWRSLIGLYILAFSPSAFSDFSITSFLSSFRIDSCWLSTMLYPLCFLLRISHCCSIFFRFSFKVSGLMHGMLAKIALILASLS